MKISDFGRYAFGICAAVAMLSGYGNNGPQLSPAGAMQQNAVQSGLNAAGSNLYVANANNDTVTVYAPGSNTVLRTISQGVSSPYTLKFGP
jgi:YVTN family beta-propeller protein